MEFNIVLPVKNAQQSDLTQRNRGERGEKGEGEKRREKKIVYIFLVQYYMVLSATGIGLHFLESSLQNSTSSIRQTKSFSYASIYKN